MLHLAQNSQTSVSKPSSRSNNTISYLLLVFIYTRDERGREEAREGRGGEGRTHKHMERRQGGRLRVQGKEGGRNGQPRVLPSLLRSCCLFGGGGGGLAGAWNDGAGGGKLYCDNGCKLRSRKTKI